MTDTALSDLQPPRYARFLDDFWNPILVKEIRQALRGRWFMVVFLLAVGALTLASVAAILEYDTLDQMSARRGQGFFMGVFACMTIATCGLLPFGAYASMGSEWDENTYDLLVLSNLRPRQILFGKLLSAWAQVALMFATFGPYVAFSFLLRGNDLLAIMVCLGGAFLWSMALCTAALSISTYSRQRIGRIALMAIVAAGLAGATGATIAMAEEFIRRPPQLRDREFWEAAVGIFLVVAFAVSLLFCSACNMLAHEEENRSTNVRVLFTVTLLCGLGFLTYITTRYPDADGLAASVIMCAVMLGIVCLFLVTEPDGLGRRVQLQVPRNPLLALCATPWLPGGGRGVLYLLLHLLLLGVFLIVTKTMLLLPLSSEPLLASGTLAVASIFLYVLIYLLLPSGLFAPFTSGPIARAAVRGSVPLVLVLFLLGPSLVGLFLQDPGLSDFRHPGNPGYLANRVWRDGTLKLPGYWMLLAGMALLGLALNLPRIWRSVTELQAARAARLAREQRRQEPAVHADPAT